MVESANLDFGQLWDLVYSEEYSRQGKPSLFKSRLESFEFKLLPEGRTVYSSPDYGKNKRISSMGSSEITDPFNFSKVPDEVNLLVWDTTSVESNGPKSRNEMYHVLKSFTELEQSGVVLSPTLSALKVNMSPLFRSHCLYIPNLLRREA